MKSAIVLILLISPLQGCSTVHSKALPDVPAYTKQQQRQALKELNGCNCPTIWQMLSDYLTMRDQTRALK